MQLNRRLFVAGAAAVAAHVAMPTLARGETPHIAHTFHNLPFRVAVINDEISDDLDHACRIVAVDLGLQFIELRSFWGKNVSALTDVATFLGDSLARRWNGGSLNTPKHGWIKGGS